MPTYGEGFDNSFKKDDMVLGKKWECCSNLNFCLVFFVRFGESYTALFYILLLST